MLLTPATTPESETKAGGISPSGKAADVMKTLALDPQSQ